MIIIILFSCTFKTVKIGSVDLVDSKTCLIQMNDETTVEMNSKLCQALKEGDIIEAKRKRQK